MEKRPDEVELPVVRPKTNTTTLISGPSGDSNSLTLLGPPPLPAPLDMHIEALTSHVSQLSRTSYSVARDFVDQVLKKLEDALGGPPSPTLWMLRELKRNPQLYLDSFNVLLMGKLAESAARHLQIFDANGKVPSDLMHEAYEVCQSVARSMNYRVLGLPPD